jgi:predicted metal-dependent phosphotriesterase family hydrolase
MPGYPPEGYGRLVMMGSYDVPFALAAAKSNDPPVWVVRDGAVVPEAKAVLAVAKKHNLSIGTGHNSGPESLVIVKEAIAQGISPVRISITHANETIPGLTLAEMQEAAKLGAFVEMASQTQRAVTPADQKALDAKNDRIADLIKKVGPNNIIMETDLGQSDFEYHADGFAAFIRNMQARGISAADTDIMTKRNPARFLGIPEAAPGRSQ